MKRVEVSELQGPLTELMSQLGGANGRQRLQEFNLWLKGVTSRFVKIVRGRFNPAEFIGQGWSIVADETDARSIALTELDLNKVQQVTMLKLKDGETCVRGEEKLKRLKSSDYIRLDADIFLMLWTNQSLIPESWKEKVNGNIRYIHFDGMVLRDPCGNRCVLFLYWSVGGWHRDVSWLGYSFDRNCVSAVLAS